MFSNVRLTVYCEVAAVTAGNLDVAKIDGQWLITNFVGSTSELKI